MPTRQAKTSRGCGMWVFVVMMVCSDALAQNAPLRVSDTMTPLHALQPDYQIPYGGQSVEAVTQVLDRIHAYLEATTLVQRVDRQSHEPITDLSQAGPDAMFAQGDFRLISYQWGVTYAGMLNAGQATGDKKFTDYVTKRLAFIKDVVDHYRVQAGDNGNRRCPVNSVLNPRALDDAGSMCAAMIKTERAGFVTGLRPMIDNYADYMSNRQFRLRDGTLARNRPLPNTLWLDDLFMSVPGLAQMGKLTGERKYYDDAVKQVL